MLLITAFFDDSRDYLIRLLQSLWQKEFNQDK